MRVVASTRRLRLPTSRALTKLVYHPGIPDGLSASTEHLHSEPLQMPSGLRSTMNGTGYEFAKPSPLLQWWLDSYDGQSPLLDVGCAYGRNSFAAAAHLARTHGEPSGTRVLAIDCDRSHLDIVAAEHVPGVEVVEGKLPDALPPVPNGSVSGILISEVFHFLTGEGIECALANARELLRPGGILCITACSPSMNLIPDETTGDCALGDLIRNTYRANEAAGKKWPGESFNLRSMTSGLQVDGLEEASARLTTHFHSMGLEPLRAACVDAGFEVEVAQYGWHEGYAECYRYDGRENCQVVGRKKKRLRL